MRSYLISYDAYSSNTARYVVDYIKGFDIWAHVTETTWFVKTNMAAADIRDGVGSVMRSGDRIFVCELTGYAAWRNVFCTHEFLKENL